MSRFIRLYSAENLAKEAIIELSKEQAHYLIHVLRLPQHAEFFIFNENDGEFIAKLNIGKKQRAKAHILAFHRAAEIEQDLLFCFAPIKKLRLDYMMQKLVEMGVSTIQPVATEYTQDSKLNYKKIKANIIEATEQCGRISIATINEICKLNQLLEKWNQDYHLLFCDEKADETQSIKNLSPKAKKIAVLIGPEGGFSAQEREALLACSFVSAISLGKNILRSDTAAVVALAYAQLMVKI